MFDVDETLAPNISDSTSQRLHWSRAKEKPLTRRCKSRPTYLTIVLLQGLGPSENRRTRSLLRTVAYNKAIFPTKSPESVQSTAVDHSNPR